MKTVLLLSVSALLITSCQQAEKPTVDKEKTKTEIFQTEKAFEKMTVEKGVAEAFYYFADERAVIKRENDSLIIGKDNVRMYYASKKLDSAVVNWTPDFIDVADDGTLAYTYGKFGWKIRKEDGTTAEYKGVFHTVWKKQADGSWKYVWD